jgi:CelD/BcsL family acetyltransferase involved in cellulose biosynthesis
VRDCDEVCIPGASAELLSAAGGLLHVVDRKPAFKADNLAAIGASSVGAVLSRNARQQLANSFRAYEAFGALTVDEAATPGQALQYFEDLKTLHSRSWTRRGRAHAFRHPYFEAFHRALIASAHGAVQMLKISAGANVVGYLYNFRHNGKIYAYQSGFADEDSDLRPGYVCHALAMERSAREGMVEYDFLAGDNRLKRSFAKAEYAMGWHKFARPSPLLRLEAAAGAIRTAMGS